MEKTQNMDLDISHYNLDELLTLFQISSPIDEHMMKKSKDIVHKMHPDKSKLPPDYFIFFGKAYKKLYSIYQFQHKKETQWKEGDHVLEYENMLINDNDNDNDNDNNNNNNKSSSKKDTENHYEQLLKTNQELKNPVKFNQWFNEQFNKNKITLESEEKGYGNWLSSNEDSSSFEQVYSVRDMMFSIEKQKQKQSQMQVQTHFQDELIFSSFGNSSSCFGSLNDQAPQEYQSDLFSKLPFEDLRKAHTETLIPVSEQDFLTGKKEQFKNVDDYKIHRSQQNLKPLSEKEANDFLREKSNKMELDASHVAFKLAQQVEESEKKNKNIWNYLMKN